MNGIELSEAYYRAYGEEMLKTAFPGLYPRIAAGVCGPGSENLGFDDETSRDHDFDPGFFLWLNAGDHKEFEFRLSRAYDKLPREFMGVKLQGMSAYGNARHGVRETAAFFREITGVSGVPATLTEWVRVPQHRLAEAVNGRIFYDGKGDVTALREALRDMPEDARKKKLARHVIFAAQAGQYNYSRALAHGQPGAAALSLSRFAENYAQAAFLLNRRYAPFYKWLLRAGKDLPILGEEIRTLETMLCDPPDKENPARIEALASAMITELTKQGLTDHPAAFLEPHAYEIMARIEDPELKSMHVME